MFGSNGAAPGQVGERPIDVFISYSNLDAAHAETLQGQLEGLGLKVWRDKTELEAGDPFIPKINAALDQAARVIVLWSQASVRSNWVLGEADKARIRKKIIPIRIDDCELLAPFNVLHTVPLSEVAANSELVTRALATQRLAGGGLYIPKSKAHIDIARLPTTYAKRLYGRESEMADLYKAWDSLDAGKTNVVVLDAMGGTGKTALINHFVHGLSAQGWRGADAVFVWSFYSQGTDDKRQASADEFFKTALEWFGYTGPAPTSPHEKGVKLAELVAAKRTLLILDGLEPLQHGPSRRSGGAGDAGLTGGLKDQGLRALLRQLAAENPGLAVVTTRLRVPDLKGLPEPAVLTERLGPIPVAPAVELIRDLGVRGKPEEIGELVKDLSGHAIALTQVATYLAKYHQGDVRCRDELPSLVDLGGDNERDPFRVMMAYESLFKRQVAEQTASGQNPADISAAKQLALLYLMGLFDRPMEKADREALLAPPGIPGLTEAVAGLTPRQLDYAVESLRDLGLLLPQDKSAPDDLDAHPLVREYFGARLEKEGAAAEAGGGINPFKSAHGRLYDHYRYRGLPAAFRSPVTYGLMALRTSYPSAPYREAVDALIGGRLSDETLDNIPTSLRRAHSDELESALRLIDRPEWGDALTAFLPETGEAMAPLFVAITHAAAAHRYDEAFLEVYFPRIARGNAQYAVHNLGLHGSNLSALAHFFAEPFELAQPSLSVKRQAVVLNLAGFALRALGRLGEALEPMRASVRLSVEQSEFGRAGDGSESLSELLLTLGEIRDAIETSSAAIHYQDKTDRHFDRMSARVGHADALLQGGHFSRALAQFVEAEKMQRERQPGLPLFSSVASYRYCDLRLSQGRTKEVLERAQYAIDLAQRKNWLLDIALNTLSLGQAAHQATLEARSRCGAPLVDAPSAGASLDEAVHSLREAGGLDDLPRGLLARAAYHRAAGDSKLANRDLMEAFDVSERGGMRLFLAQCWTESARQKIAFGESKEAALGAAEAALRAASDLIIEMGAHRRDPDLVLARAELALAAGDVARGEAHLASLIGFIRSHDFWGFLPEVEGLITRFGITKLEPAIAELRADRARFDSLADRDFEAARRVDRSDGLDDAVIDAFLADPNFRERLSNALVANGYKPLDATPLEEQRDDARAFVKQLRDAAKQSDRLDDPIIDVRLGDPQFRGVLASAMAESGMPLLDTLSLAEQREYARKYIVEVERQGKSEAVATEAEEIPDELISRMLSTPEHREMLASVLRENGHDLDELPVEEQRTAAREFILLIRRQAKEQEKPDEEATTAETMQPEAPPPLPDAVVDDMLCNAEIRAALSELYKNNGIDAPFESLPRELHATLLARLVADGAISIGQATPPRSEPAPPEPEDRGGQRETSILRSLFGSWMRR